MNATKEMLPNGTARLIVYPEPLHPEIRIVHDFPNMAMLEKYFPTATRDAFDVVV